MSIIRKDPRLHKSRGGSFAKGLRAVAIDQRTGFKHLQSHMVFEPGTNYYVHKDESDGSFNLVTDPLNYVSDKMKRPERQALRYSSPEYSMSIGAIVSAEQLGLPSYASVSGQFIDYANIEVSEGGSGFTYRFNLSKNSFYIMTRGF